jgi:hypothetical protein
MAVARFRDFGLHAADLGLDQRKADLVRDIAAPACSLSRYLRSHPPLREHAARLRNRPTLLTARLYLTGCATNAVNRTRKWSPGNQRRESGRPVNKAFSRRGVVALA